MIKIYEARSLMPAKYLLVRQFSLQFGNKNVKREIAGLRKKCLKLHIFILLYGNNYPVKKKFSNIAVLMKLWEPRTSFFLAQAKVP